MRGVRSLSSRQGAPARGGRLTSPRLRVSRRSSADGRPGVARPRGASSRSRDGAPSRPLPERRASPDRYGEVGGRPPAPRPEFWPRRGADGEEGIPPVYGPSPRYAKASRSPRCVRGGRIRLARLPQNPGVHSTASLLGVLTRSVAATSDAHGVETSESHRCARKPLVLDVINEAGQR